MKPHSIFRLSMMCAMTALLPGMVAAETLDLARALDQARSNDPQWAAVEHGRLAGQEAENLGLAGLLPKIGANAASTHSTLEPASTPSLSNTSQSWGVSLQQPLFSLTAWHDYQRGKLATEQTNADFAAREQDFLVRVASTYFDVLRAQVQLETRKAEETAVSRQLEQTRQRFKVGLVPKTDVLDAEAALDLTAVARIAAETQVQVAQRNLASLTRTSVDGVADLQAKAPVISPEPADQAAWVKRALDNNPSVKAARLGEETANQQYKSIHAGHMPTVSATATRSHDSRYVQTNEGMDQTAFGLRVDLPLFSGGATSAASRQSLNQYYQAKDLARYAEQSADLGAANLYLLVNNHVKRVAAYEQSIKSTEAALTSTQAGYEAGTRTIVEVLNAQKSLYGARSDYANARYDYVIDSLKLKQAAGMLGPDDLRTLNGWLQK